jgi:hypothetical protein
LVRELHILVFSGKINQIENVDDTQTGALEKAMMERRLEYVKNGRLKRWRGLRKARGA